MKGSSEIEYRREKCPKTTTKKKQTYDGKNHKYCFEIVL